MNRMPHAFENWSQSLRRLPTYLSASLVLCGLLAAISCGDGKNGDDSLNTPAPEKKPNPPRLIAPGSSDASKAPSITGDSIKFEWNPEAGASQYGLAVSAPPYGSGDTIFQKDEIRGTDTSFTPQMSIVFKPDVVYRWTMVSRKQGRLVSGDAGYLYFRVGTPTEPKPPSDSTQLTLEKIDRRLKALPPYPEYLHGTSTDIMGSIADTAIEISARKRLAEYDKWHQVAVDYRVLAEVTLYRAKRHAADGDIINATKYIEEFDRDLKVFFAAQSAAISTYEANIERASYYATTVYETSHALFVLATGPAGLGPVASFFASNLYTSLDFVITASEEGKGEALKGLGIELVARAIAGEIVPKEIDRILSIQSKDLSKYLRALAINPAKLELVVNRISQETGKHVTKELLKAWIEKSADQAEEICNKVPDRPPAQPAQETQSARPAETTPPSATPARSGRTLKAPNRQLKR